MEISKDDGEVGGTHGCKVMDVLISSLFVSHFSFR